VKEGALLPFAPRAVMLKAESLQSPAGYPLRVEGYERLRSKALRAWKEKLGESGKVEKGKGAYPYLLRLIMAQVEEWGEGQAKADLYYIQVEGYITAAPLRNAVEWAYYVLLYIPPAKLEKPLWESPSAPYLAMPVLFQRWAEKVGKSFTADATFLGMCATILARGDAMRESLLRVREWPLLLTLWELAKEAKEGELKACLQEATSLHALVKRVGKRVGR